MTDMGRRVVALEDSMAVKGTGQMELARGQMEFANLLRELENRLSSSGRVRASDYNRTR